jgi:hypothetical protein
MINDPDLTINYIKVIIFIEKILNIMENVIFY